MPEPELHPSCEAAAFLLGTWRGDGHGGYPEMRSFAYREEMRVWHTGKAYLAFEQRTWEVDAAAKTVREVHGESGYLRCLEGGGLELAVAMAPGHVELSSGSVEGMRITLASSGVIDSPHASPVSAVKRTWWLEGDLLRYDLEMSAKGQPMGWHLSAELRRA
jgi:THAP4-like, heme-binding beta-barrel domain